MDGLESELFRKLVSVKENREELDKRMKKGGSITGTVLFYDGKSYKIVDNAIDDIRERADEIKARARELSKKAQV
ncbi:MAG: hypothetical protein QM751_03980 [Paludibacteraceae bacterium]